MRRISQYGHPLDIPFDWRQDAVTEEHDMAIQQPVGEIPQICCSIDVRLARVEGSFLTSQRSIETTEELYRKLERTFERRSTYGQHQVDWVFDFAVTAWHLADWLAREANTTGKSAVRDTQERLKRQCPELFVCEQVCNGAKHFVLDNAELKPFNVAVDVCGTNDLKGVRLNVVPGDGQSYDIVLTPVVLITDRDQKSWEAIELFRKVLSFWQRELGVLPG